MIYSMNKFNNFDIATESAMGADELSMEDHALILESAMMEAASAEEIEAFLESTTEVDSAVGAEILLERNIVRLDKVTKLKGATATAVFTLARKAKDPLMKKLIKLWKLEAVITKKLKAKYENKAVRHAKQTMKNAKQIPGKLVNKVTQAAKSQFSSVKK